MRSSIALLIFVSCNARSLPGAPTSYPAFVTDAVQAYCERRVQCGFLDPSRESDCEVAARHDFACDPSAAVTAGRLMFEPAIAQQQLAAIENADCIDGAAWAAFFQVTPAWCALELSAEVPTGGACYDTRDCSVPGDGCACVGATCPGRCAPTGSMPSSSPGAAGAPCTYDNGLRCDDFGPDECQPGLICVPNADYHGGTCGSPAAVGARVPSSVGWPGSTSTSSA